MAENSSDIHYQTFTVYSHYSGDEIATSITSNWAALPYLRREMPVLPCNWMLLNPQYCKFEMNPRFFGIWLVAITLS